MKNKNLIIVLALIITFAVLIGYTVNQNKNKELENIQFESKNEKFSINGYLENTCKNGKQRIIIENIKHYETPLLVKTVKINLYDKQNNKSLIEINSDNEQSDYIGKVDGESYIFELSEYLNSKKIEYHLNKKGCDTEILENTYLKIEVTTKENITLKETIYFKIVS